MDFPIITSKHNLPYEIEIRNPVSEEQHIHPELELVLILKGTVEYSVNYKKYILNQRDFFFVNSLENHHINSYSAESRILSIHIDLIAFTRFYPDITCCPFLYKDTLNNRNNHVYKNIYSQLHTLLVNLVEKPDTFLLISMVCISNILIELCQSCMVSRSGTASLQQDDRRNRIMNILSYMNDNYSEPITLEQLSEKFNLSKPYLSKYFKNSMGIGFLDYINKLRINKSVDMLIHTDDRIIDIALANGFNTQKSYSRVFQKEFGTSPSEYRMKAREKENTDAFHFSDNPPADDQAIWDFSASETENRPAWSEQAQTGNIALNVKTTTDWNLKQIWNQTLFIGNGSLCLKHSVQQEIKDMIKDFSFQYLRFYGIFSDDLFFCHEKTEGNYLYFWNEIDELLDFICGLSLKPFIVFGPSYGFFASKRNFLKINYQNYSMLGLGKKWETILTDFLSHCIKRYGKEAVSTWKFQIWSVPSYDSSFSGDTASDFFRFMKRTYLTIRLLLPTVKIGSPGLVPFKNQQWLEQFFLYCQKEHIQFDFISLYLYAPTNPRNSNKVAFPHHELMPDDFSHSAHFFHSNVQTIIHLMQRFNSNAALVIAEWNINNYFQDYCRDTAFMLTHLLHTFLHAPKQVDEIIYSSMKDLPTNLTSSMEIFYGGPGLLTISGLRKPAYTGLWFLEKLGPKEIYRGDSYMITRSSEAYQILFYHYSYFNQTFLSGEKDLLSSLDRYNIYEKTDSMNLNLLLSIESGTYQVETYSLSPLYGSVFDAWLRMGHPDKMTPSIHKYLSSQDGPSVTVEIRQVTENLLISQNLPVHGAVLLLIQKWKE